MTPPAVLIGQHFIFGLLSKNHQNMCNVSARKHCPISIVSQYINRTNIPQISCQLNIYRIEMDEKVSITTHSRTLW